jgi:Fe2+ transport system protein FeoA
MVEAPPLCEFPEGSRVIVERVSEESAEVLRYLESVRLFPGAELTISKVAPFEGPLLVITNNEALPLSREIAAKVWARPAL